MTTDDLVQDLCSWIRELPHQKNETDLHAKLLERLEALGQDHKSQYSVANPDANGRSRPDVLVTGVNPHLLIEIKASGDWKCVAQAAWQLFQSAELLREKGEAPCMFAIFGGKLNDPLLSKFLTKLNIEWECVQA